MLLQIMLSVCFFAKTTPESQKKGEKKKKRNPNEKQNRDRELVREQWTDTEMKMQQIIQ